MVPRPRVAPDEQIPTGPGIPLAAPRRPQHGGPARSPGLTRPGREARPGPGQPDRYPRRAGQPVALTRARVVRVTSAPSRMPAGRARRTRLTRRGRRVAWASAILLVLAVIIPVLLAAASGAQASNHGVPPSAVRAAMRQVVVKPGQSLWSIALSAEPKADPRVVIQQIVDFNALGSQVVVPGESLWVPKG
jgi:LysM domain